MIFKKYEGADGIGQWQDAAVTLRLGWLRRQSKAHGSMAWRAACTHTHTHTTALRFMMDISDKGEYIADDKQMDY